MRNHNRTWYVGISTQVNKQLNFLIITALFPELADVTMIHFETCGNAEVMSGHVQK